MELNLSELLDVATFEGTIIIRIWDDSAEGYRFEKCLDDFERSDQWVYSHTVKYVYPIYTYHNGWTAAVVIELTEDE